MLTLMSRTLEMTCAGGDKGRMPGWSGTCIQCEWVQGSLRTGVNRASILKTKLVTAESDSLLPR